VWLIFFTSPPTAAQQQTFAATAVTVEITSSPSFSDVKHALYQRRRRVRSSKKLTVNFGAFFVLTHEEARPKNKVRILFLSLGKKCSESSLKPGNYLRFIKKRNRNFTLAKRLKKKAQHTFRILSLMYIKWKPS
jgi:hypothetical protein